MGGESFSACMCVLNLCNACSPYSVCGVRTKAGEGGGSGSISGVIV